MDEIYPFREVEARWQRAWAERAVTAPAVGPKECIFSWPVSPCRATDADLALARERALADAVARFRKHQGVASFLTLAVDGFHAGVLEAARAGGKPPRSIVLEDAGRMETLLASIGSSPVGPPIYTSEPAYYRFTQWIFLQLHAKGLIFRSEMLRAVCSRCRRRQRVGAHTACRRCGGELSEQKTVEWRLDLRPYGDRLVADLERIDCPEGIRSIQCALLGRCRGSEVIFPVSRPFELEYQDLTVFTKRVETIFGATFLLVDLDHPILASVLDPTYEDEVARYRERLRKGAEPAISAARTGGFALNPANLKRIPILVSPLANKPYSEGAIMAVPAHDAELFVLAKRLKLPIREVIHNDKAKFDAQTRLEEPWLGDGVMTNSGSFTSLAAKVGRDRIISLLARKGVCQRANRFLLRTLQISTDSPWGPPVPLVHCKRCGVVPVPDADLPIELPAVDAALAPNEGERPLASREFSRTSCPRCGQSAARDGDTILSWLGTAWSLVRLVLPGLGGRVDGFRELEACPSVRAEPDPAAAPVAATEAIGDVGAEAHSRLPMSGENGAQAAPDGEAQPLAGDLYPEDIDIFGVTPDAGSAAPADGGPGPATEVESLTPALGELPDSLSRAEGDGVDDSGAPEASSPAEGGQDTEPAAVPPEPDARAGQDASSGEPRQRGRQDAPPGRKDPERGRARRSPADEPETIVLKDIEEDEEDLEELGQLLSPLRPFRLNATEGSLPASLALGPASLSPIDLIAARFLAKFLKDLGHFPVDEPFARYRPVAGVLTRGNGGATDGKGAADLLDRFGADALRLYLLFAAPAASQIVIHAEAVHPFRRFLDRIWRQMMLRLEKGKFVSRRMLEEKHLLIHLVTRRLSEGKIHTAVAALMRFVRFLESPEAAPEDMDRVAMRTFTILLSPFAPHLAAELWSRMGVEEDLVAAAWPIPNEELIHPPEKEFLIFVDGRIRDRMQQPSNLEPEKLESRALQRDRIREIVGMRKVEKVVVVPQRLVSIALAPP